METYFNEMDGWTYFLEEGELHRCPTNLDGTLEMENACHVDDMTFEEEPSRLEKMLSNIKLQLAN